MSSTKKHRSNQIANFSDALLQWFDLHGRKDLPWQKDINPYRVWVSEIMLQQTQVSAVIDYYQRFMSSFPTTQALATADEEAVLAHWAGLGYYARARNLHKTAKLVCEQHNGEFPQDLNDIIALPGIGRSTAGAISSIAMQKAHAILDGNVKRVLCRLHDIEGWPGQTKLEKQLWELASIYTPEQRCNDYTQAIMDFGATLCTRSKPQCSDCPFSKQCQALANKTVEQRPTPKPKKKNPVKELWLLNIESNNTTLFEKRPPTGIWGGLYSLPELSREFTIDEIGEQIESSLGLSCTAIEEDQPIKHVFSHYTLMAYPVTAKCVKTSNTIASNTLEWLNSEDLKTKGLPAPISTDINTYVRNKSSTKR